MERDFMGLNSKDSVVVVVKEEAVEGCKESVFSKSSAVNWPLSGVDGYEGAKNRQGGVARLEKRRRWEPKDRQQMLDELEKYQAEARTKRFGMWEYGDIESDDEENPLPTAKKTGAGKR